MSTTMPNPPYKVPIADQNGMMSVAWIGFFQELFKRIGQTIAPSNSDITGLQTTTDSHATSLATLEGGITKGRQL